MIIVLKVLGKDLLWNKQAIPVNKINSFFSLKDAEHEDKEKLELWVRAGVITVIEKEDTFLLTNESVEDLADRINELCRK